MPDGICYTILTPPGSTAIDTIKRITFTGSPRSNLPDASLPPAVPDAEMAVIKTPCYSLFAMLAMVPTRFIHRCRSRARQIAPDLDVPGGLWGELHGQGASPAPGTATTASAGPAVDRPVSAPAISAAAPTASDMAARARAIARSFSAPASAAPPRAPTIAAPPRAATTRPLDIDCQPTGLTVTLRHAELRYRLRLANRAEARGALVIRADLTRVEPGAEPGMRSDRLLAGDRACLPMWHYLDSLPAGGRVELTGELRWPRAGIAPLRVTKAGLLVPLVRISVESLGTFRPAVRCLACFELGWPVGTKGSTIKPFDLNAGPGSRRKLITRRMVCAD